MANIGHPQTRNHGVAEPPLVTVGDDLNNVAAFLNGRETYSAEDVVRALLADAEATMPPEAVTAAMQS
jgi:hypothetical protein